jgi:methylenetetrahydrofolate reductase (NADPH)
MFGLFKRKQAAKPSQPKRLSILDGYTVEVTTRDKKSVDAAKEALNPGTEVFVAQIPGETPLKLVDVCVTLREANLIPVPHIVARNIESAALADELLSRLVGEAGVDRCFTPGGDVDTPAGPYASSFELLQSGVYAKHGIKKLGFTCYPEGHPKISEEALAEARQSKAKLAREQGIDHWFISQMCFDAESVIKLAETLRAEGVKVPLRIGVAGPTDRKKLLRYAMVCGVGASMKVLTSNPETMGQLMTHDTPEDLLRTVQAAVEATPSLGPISTHFFTFGDLAGAAKWGDEARGA